MRRDVCINKKIYGIYRINKLIMGKFNNNRNNYHTGGNNGHRDTKVDIKSTYNFVPLADKIYIPNWHDQISHDIPFSDGISGKISFDMVAQTPIFIRNGHTKEEHKAYENWVNNGANDLNIDGSTKNYLSFSKDENGRYFIPSTTIKGVLRSILEIISNGNLNKNFVENNRYAYRDLIEESLYLTNYKPDEVHCGWLSKTKDHKWMIQDCGKPRKINYQEIDQKFNTSFLQKLTAEEYKNVSEVKFQNNSIVFINSDNKKQSVSKSEFTFLKDYKIIKRIIPKGFKNAHSKYKSIDSTFGYTNHNFNEVEVNGHKYHLVFTGSPSMKKQKEFLFPNIDSQPFEINDMEVINNFLFTYKDHDSRDVSEDWKFWRDNFLRKEKKIPLFFIKNSDGTIKHMGLSFMYKLPYNHKVHDLIPNCNTNKDLSECIFGHTDENELKGRVFISHSFSPKGTTELKLEKQVLSSPKASFFPFYLEQFRVDKKSYFTYDDSMAQLRGHKRYPIQDEIENRYQGNDNQRIATHFYPLPKTTKFNSEIRFHNLRPIELGALLSAITFHNNQSCCFHNLGMAKSYGYGKLNIVNLKLEKYENSEFVMIECLKYMVDFQKEMLDNSCWNEDRLKELFTMAEIDAGNLKHMTIKEYGNIKKPEIQKLEKYSDIVKSKKPQYIPAFKTKIENG